jgi:hypothetical protein
VRFYVRFAAYRKCELVYLRFAVRQESLSNFFCTKLQLRFGVRFRVRTLPLPLLAPNHTANRTANRMVRVNCSNSESDTKSQTRQIASAICSKSRTKSHTCNQPLRQFYPFFRAVFLTLSRKNFLLSLPSASLTETGEISLNSQLIYKFVYNSSRLEFFLFKAQVMTDQKFF